MAWAAGGCTSPGPSARGCPGAPGALAAARDAQGKRLLAAESRRGQTPTELISVAVQGPQGPSGRFGRDKTRHFQERRSSPGGFQLPRATEGPVAEFLQGFNTIVATNNIVRCAA